MALSRFLLGLPILFVWQLNADILIYEANTDIHTAPRGTPRSGHRGSLQNRPTENTHF